jgi:hypothetical protein
MKDSLILDIGAYLKGALALIPAVITAGAGNDGVQVAGPAVDLWQWGNSRPRSAVLLLNWSAVLAQAKTLSLAADIQDDTVSAFNGTPALYGPALTNGVVATGPTGGGTMQGVTAVKLPLIGARRYLRTRVTADLNAANTDTVALSGILVVGGFDQLPAS